MVKSKRTCDQEDTCPSWGNCPFKRDLNACRAALSVDLLDGDIEEID